MKILKTANYKKAQNDLGLGGAFQGGAEGVNKAADQKAIEYAQKVMYLINQGVPQQDAFNQVMQQMGIGSKMQVFRGKIIEQIKILYNQQLQQYAKLVIDEINKGIPQQQAFDQILGNADKNFRNGVFKEIQQMWKPQPAFEKTYNQQ